MTTCTTRLVFLWFAIATVMFGPTAQLIAQPAGSGKTQSAKEQPQSLPWSGWRDDPIGLERSDEALDRVRTTQKTDSGSQVSTQAGQSSAHKSGAPRILVGEVLSALSSVSESEHQTAARFSSGLAIITDVMRFVSQSEAPAQLCYRQAVPDDASLISLEACNRDGCRQGIVDTVLVPQEGVGCDAALNETRASPAARAALRSDNRGQAAMVRAAWVKKGDDLTIRLQYLVRAPQYHGVTRVRLPPRGMDERAAPTESGTIASNGQKNAVSINGNAESVMLDPWVPIEFTQRSSDAQFQAQAWQFPCNGKQCARIRMSSPAPQPTVPVDMVIAVDVSPSTLMLSQNRIPHAVAFLLAAAPAGSRVRALAFASRTRILVGEPMDAQRVSLAWLTQSATEANLGSATRFESVWNVANGWFTQGRTSRLRPLIVVLGDGGLTESKDNPFLRVKRAGVELSVLNISDRPTNPSLRNGAMVTGGIVVDAGAEAKNAANGHGVEPFEERIAAIFAPVITRRILLETGKQPIVLGTLRAGEEIVWEGISDGNRLRLTWPGKRLRGSAPPKDIALALGSHALIAVLSPSSPTKLKEDRSTIGAGMPSGPLLSMLRQRVLPVARGCFRKDRAGRTNYQTRATFVLRLAEQEVTFTDVEGSITEELKRCLMAATDALDVPRFYGTVLVRYPLVTEAEPTIEQIELPPKVLQQVNAISGVASPQEK